MNAAELDDCIFDFFEPIHFPDLHQQLQNKGAQAFF